MKTIHLHDKLGEEFGGPYTLEVKNAREALHALASQIPNFGERVREGQWHILHGALEDKNDISEDDLDLLLGTQDSEIHVMSAISGAGNGGGLSIVLGIVAIVAAPFTGGYSMAFYAAGVGMLVGGLIQMSIKIPGADTDTSSVDQRASFLFTGPRNTSSQGVTIPRGYGRCWSGSLVISSGLYAEEITT